ncbi:MAG TPA: Yip1 family protein [Methanoregulaceae archaeon]|nr:Yip1 family protein [Methanoregulaceae archaeon]
MIQKIMDLLIRPDSFFSEKANEPENLKIPGLIVLIGAILAALAAYQVSGLTARIFSQAATAGMSSIIGIIGAISGLLGFIILWWLIVTGIFFLVSMVFSGKGSFKRTLENVGYGLVPMIFGSFVTLLLSFYYLPMVRVPVVHSIQDPAAMQQAVMQLTQDPSFREFTQVSTIIALIFLIWSANVWIFGIKYARELSLRNAIITVGIPVLLYIIYMLYTIFAGFPIAGGA